MYFYNKEQQKAWKYKYPEIQDSSKRFWIAGATMCYRKSLWEQKPFDEVNIGEDNQFVWNCKGEVSTHNHIEDFVSLLHKGNTSPKYTNDTSRWFPQDVEMVKGIVSRIEK